MRKHVGENSEPQKSSHVTSGEVRTAQPGPLYVNAIPTHATASLNLSCLFALSKPGLEKKLEIRNEIDQLMDKWSVELTASCHVASAPPTRAVGARGRKRSTEHPKNSWVVILMVRSPCRNKENLTQKDVSVC